MPGPLTITARPQKAPSPMTMYVAQPNGYGCAIASLAMPGGLTSRVLDRPFTSETVVTPFGTLATAVA